MEETHKIPSWVLRLLHDIRGVDARPGPTPGSLEVAVNHGNPATFDVRYIPVLSQERIAQLLQEWHHDWYSGYSLPFLATRYLSDASRDFLRKSDVSWVEQETGTCRIIAPGLLVDTKSEHWRPARAPAPARGLIRGRSGLIVEALLTKFRNSDVKLSMLSEAVDVSRPLVSRVLTRLTELRLITNLGAGPNSYWRISDVGGLLDLWTSEERKPPQTASLYVYARNSRALYEKLVLLNNTKIRWAVGGVAAANLYAPTLTSDPEPTIWIDSWVPAKDIAAALAGEVVETGANVYIWQSENNFALRHAGQNGSMVITGLNLVSEPRAFVESSMLKSQRALEVSQNLRQRIIANG